MQKRDSEIELEERISVLNKSVVLFKKILQLLMLCKLSIDTAIFLYFSIHFLNLLVFTFLWILLTMALVSLYEAIISIQIYAMRISHTASLITRVNNYQKRSSDLDVFLFKAEVEKYMELLLFWRKLFYLICLSTGIVCSTALAFINVI